MSNVVQQRIDIEQAVRYNLFNSKSHAEFFIHVRIKSLIFVKYINGAKAYIDVALQLNN